MCLQLSTISRKVARAAARALDSSSWLYLSEAGPAPRFQSLLMQKWAPRLLSLTLWGPGSYSLPGLIAFLTAASSLREVDVIYDSAIAAAEVSCLLPVCTASVVTLRGPVTPANFPQGMCSLHVDFDDDAPMNSPSQWDPQMPSILIHHLLHQKSLKTLEMKMWHISSFVIACPMQLPMLDISLSFSLWEDSEIDLSWLQHQPCSLSLDILIRTSAMDAHEALIEQLRFIPIKKIELDISTTICAQVQVLWKQLVVKESCCLLVGSASSSRGRSVSDAMQILPSCPLILFKTDYHPRELDSSALFVSWSALMMQPRTVRFELHSGWVLHVLGGCEPPPACEQPWLFSVGAGCQVHGLPDICRRHDGSWLLQNDTAE